MTIRERIDSAILSLYLFPMLFGMSGRLNRTNYWIALAITTLIVMPALVLTAVKPRYSWDGWIIIASWVLGGWAWSAILVKRLHDLNLSGWWWLLIWLLPIGALGVAVEVAFKLTTGQQLETGELGATILGIVIFSILGAVKGTVGTNRYGPDLLAPETPC